MKSRMQNLEKRLGGKEKMDEYFKNMWEEKAKTFFEDITQAAEESLEKFFILQKFTELLKLDVDWNKTEHFAIEQKIYDALLKKNASWKSENKKDDSKKEEKKTKKSA
jgi:hypothetical protein